MEDHSVVVILLDQLDEVFTGFRAIFQVKVQMDVTTSGLKDYLVLLLDSLGETSGLVFLSA